METEPARDPMDQLAVTVLADQDVELSPSVGQGQHELPSMPESDKDRTAGFPERVNAIGMPRSYAQRPAEHADRHIAECR